MIRKNNLEDITDEEFETIVMPHDNLIYKHIRDNILYEFVAYYLASGYDQNALWECSLKQQVNSALNAFTDISKNDPFDYTKLKQILIDKYSLKIIDDNTTQMIKLDN